MQIESRSRLGRIYQSDRRPSAYTSVRYLTGILVAAVLPCKRTETACLHHCRVTEGLPMPVSRKLSAFALVAWVAIAFPPLAFSGGDWPDGLINSGSRTSFVQTIICAVRLRPISCCGVADVSPGDASS
jgi:hypothetical protein